MQYDNQHGKGNKENKRRTQKLETCFIKKTSCDMHWGTCCVLGLQTSPTAIPSCPRQLRKLLLSLCKHLFMSNLTFDTSCGRKREHTFTRICVCVCVQCTQRVGPAQEALRPNLSAATRCARTCPCYT